MKIQRLGALALALGAIGVPASAQQDPVVSKGFEPGKVYQFGGVDSIDTTTGRVGIVLPIGPRFAVNGGFSYGLKVSYNSNVWDYVIRNTTCGTPPQPCSWIDAFPNRTSNAGLGWLLTLGRLYDGRDTKNPISGASTYVSPDGAEHPFGACGLHYGEPCPSTDGTHTYLYTLDGSYLRMQTTPGNDTTRVIEHPDGTMDTFVLYDAQNYYWRLASISERFGNNITVTYSDNTPTANWTAVDSQGRVQHVYFGYVNGFAYVSQVILTAFGGTTATYTFNYTSSVIHRSCQDMDPQDPATVGVAFLSSITLPDGTAWSMPQYHVETTGCTAGADVNGVLENLGLPTGGHIAYQWQQHTYQASAVLPPPCPPKPQPCITSYKQAWAAISTRTLSDALGSPSGTWTYKIWTGWRPITPNVGIPLERRVVVTDPNLNDTVYYSRAYPWDFGSNYDYDPNALMWDYALPYTRRCQSSTQPWDSTCPSPPVSSPPAASFLSIEYYQGQVADYTATPVTPAAGASRKRSVFVKYAHDQFYPGWSLQPPNPPDAPFGSQNRYLISERTVYEDDPACGGACYAQTDYSHYDGLGHYRTATTSGNFPSGNVRTTTTGFNPGPSGSYPDYTVADDNSVSGGYPAAGFPLAQPWILDTFGKKEQSEGTATAHAEYCFEMNGSNYPSTGFLLRSRTYAAGTSPSGADVVSSYARDANGNMTSEQSFGGDGANLGSGGLCTLALPANTYRIDHTYQYGSLQTSRYVDAAGTPLSFYLADHDIDFNTGLIASSHGSSGGTKGQGGYDAGLVTDFTYDGLGRMTWAKPRSTPVNGGAWTNYVYTPVIGTTPAKVSIYQYPNNSTSGALSQQEYSYDGFGRVIKQRQLLASGAWNQRLTTYNSSGWKLSVSELQPDGTAGSNLRTTSYSSFDPFGRPLTITPPDGTGHNVTMTYAGVRQVTRTLSVGTTATTESSSTTTETYDRQGRLSTVAEPSGSGGAVVTTTYGYDVGNRLHTVSTPSGLVTQNRTFTYDARGFLTSEQQPEKGATGNGTVTYSSYDACGHAGRVVDGPNDVTLLYDRAERLYQAKITNTSTLLKEFTYGTANAAGNYVNGKLVQAKRHNWSGTSDEQVTETYTYGGVGGRVSQRSTMVGLLLPSADTRTISQAFTWNDLGQTASTGYPDDLGLGTDPVRTVSFTYTNGFLTAVPSFAGSISYHPNTMVNQVAHANGVTDTYGKDPNDMARPASISTSGAATNWATGTYQYDGAGDVWKVGTDTSLYDLVTRLKEGNVGSVTQKQCAVFDAFGNVLGLSQIASGGTCPTTGSYSIDGSTNRFLSPVTYDAAGNETYRGGTTYTFDKWSQMATATGTGINRAYLYTADGERIAERDNTAATITVTVRDLSNKVLRIFSKSGGVWSWSKDYVYRDGLLLASVESTGTKHFHLDHLGTVRRITGTGTPAAVLASHDYYPFGLEATSPAQDREQMKYTGHERDAATALDYMHARHYNFGVGRFTSVDAGHAAPGAPQSWNRYAYSRDNPMKYLDPDGQQVAPAIPVGGYPDPFAETMAVLLRMPSLGDPRQTNLQVMGASLQSMATRVVVAAAVLNAATTLFRPGPPDNWQRQKDAAQNAKRLRESSVGGTSGPRPPRPGDDLPPGAPGPSFKPRELGPSPDETDIFRWTQPSFPLGVLAIATAESLEQQQDDDLRQYFLNSYGPGPWLQTDPGSLTDSMGNPVQNPNPR